MTSRDDPWTMAQLDGQLPTVVLLADPERGMGQLENQFWVPLADFISDVLALVVARDGVQNVPQFILRPRIQWTAGDESSS